jgi:stringent starvation protein A
MGVTANKRSSMAFFSDPRDHYCHRVRIVLAEKGVTVDVVNVEPGDHPQELAENNPYNSVPTLLDRDLVLYEPNIMMEYLDEPGAADRSPLLPYFTTFREGLLAWGFSS